jgi:ParB-like chromosome segregation protein Spo0J
MAKPIAFPTSKPLPLPPDISELTVEERNAWEWMMSGTASFDAQLINLSPRLARLLITRIGDNRKPKRAVIQRYANVMNAGQWQLTHQGIGISVRGEVIDGQHRIFAVIESGMTIEVLVVRGVSQDAMLVLDNGVQRTDADSIRIADFGLSDLEQIEATSAKRMVRGARKFMRPMSRADLRSFILRHRAVIQLAQRGLWQEGRVPNVTHSEVVAVLARAAYHCSREDLLTAAAFLASGNAATERLEPLLVLREWLLKGSKQIHKQRYGKTERAMQMFINAARLGSKRLSDARDELFPLPEEKAVDAGSGK